MALLTTSALHSFAESSRIMKAIDVRAMGTKVKEVPSTLTRPARAQSSAPCHSAWLLLPGANYTNTSASRHQEGTCAEVVAGVAELEPIDLDEGEQARGDEPRGDEVLLLLVRQLGVEGPTNNERDGHNAAKHRKGMLKAHDRGYPPATTDRDSNEACQTVCGLSRLSFFSRREV